jgi:D-beta-D-heptose 7-phosphate kinase/D-beta-D-heptose 1-phosphate adenosyltransferase
MVSLEKLAEKISHTSLMCVGDVMIDYFVYGRVDRISPEAPVPVFHKSQQTCVLGGAGNVVRNLASLCAQTIFISLIGGDKESQVVKQLLSNLPYNKSFLIKDPTRDTTVKTRYISHNQQLLRVDHETTHYLPPELMKQVREAFEQSLHEVNAVILSDYGKGLFAPDLVRFLIELAKSSHKPIIVDPKGYDYSFYKGATILTPNLKELSHVSQKSLKTEEEIVQAARDLLNQHQIEFMLVTRGEHGMTLVDSHELAIHIPTQALEVFDVSGAGDTVIAMLSAAYAAGVPLLEAASLANAAAGIVVGKVGTATITLKEVQEKFRSHSAREASHKIQSLSDVLSQVIAWRRKGLKVGFTNGCFDLLHPGHISLLSQAKNECDRLIVGLNSDDSIKRLKGPNRPVQEQEARATVLASLEYVDRIVIFEEDTPLALIKQLRPDVLVKGADYTLEKVVGAQEVANWGGRVILADLVPSHSTTNTIQRINIK